MLKMIVLSVRGYGKLSNLREKSGNFEVDDKWQACLTIRILLGYIVFFSHISI